MTDIASTWRQSGQVAPTYITWRYHTDPEFRANMIKRSIEYTRERRQRDPEYNEMLKEQWRNYARKNAEKIAQDPEKLAKRKEYLRNYYLRKKASASEKQIE